MCTGLEIAALAAGGIGSAVQGAAVRRNQNDTVRAENAQLNQFLDRNKQRQQEAEALFAQRQAAIQPEAAQTAQADATTARQDATTAAVDRAVPAIAAPLRGSAATLIGDTYGAESDKARTDATARANALSTTAGFGDALFNQGVGTADAARKIGTIGGLAGADASMLPYYQQLAAAQVKPVSPIGGIIASLGNAAGSYAGSRVR